MTTCGALLSIPEIQKFAEEYLQEQLADAPTPVLQTAADIVTEFAGTADATPATAKLVLESNRGAACELMRVVLILFDVPMQIVRKQLETTVGIDGTGTGKLRSAIDRLALSARFLKQTYKANKFTPPSVEMQMTAVVAVGLNALRTWNLDYSAVTLPVGWSMADDQPTDGSLTQLATVHARRMAQRVALIDAAIDDILAVGGVRALRAKYEELLSASAM